jgi:hypothetical protein
MRGFRQLHGDLERFRCRTGHTSCPLHKDSTPVEGYVEIVGDDSCQLVRRAAPARLYFADCITGAAYSVCDDFLGEVRRQSHLLEPLSKLHIGLHSYNSLIIAPGERTRSFMEVGVCADDSSELYHGFSEIVSAPSYSQYLPGSEHAGASLRDVPASAPGEMLYRVGQAREVVDDIVSFYILVLLVAMLSGEKHRAHSGLLGAEDVAIHVVADVHDLLCV